MRDIPVDSLNHQFASAWKNLNAFNYTRLEWHSLVNQTFLGLTESAVSNNLFSELYDRFAQADAWRIFDDVVPALEFLNSRGLKLGIISNWDERLRPLLRHLNLDHFFQAIVASCEVGQCKPSPAIFNRASELLVSSPTSMLHIGDNPDLDVDGARGAGFHALLLAREQSATPGELNSLGQLHDLFTQSLEMGY